VSDALSSLFKKYSTKPHNEKWMKFISEILNELKNDSDNFYIKKSSY